MSTCEKCGWWDRLCHCKGNPTDPYLRFTPYVYTDLGIEPIEVTSKSQLKKICEERGLKAVRLM